MEFKTIEIKRDTESRVTTILMNRPSIEGKDARVNSINSEMLDEFDKALDFLYTDKDTHVIVLRGANGAFSGGGDLGSESVSEEMKSETPWEAKKGIIKAQRTFKRFRDFPKPIIAAIEGYALGGGLELAMSCDIRYAMEGAIFGQQEVKIGLMPSWGGTQLMARIIGVGRTMELILTGEVIRAKRALEIGLINRIFATNRFERQVYKVAKKMANECAPISLGIAKQMINFGSTVPFDIGLELESYGVGLVASTEDSSEGVDAFMKRKPNFKNK